MKRLGLRIPNEKDGKIQGTIIKTSPSSIEKGNAKLREMFAPGIWNEDDYDYKDDSIDEEFNE